MKKRNTIKRESNFPRSEIVAAFAVGSAAILISGLQPVLLGALVRESVMSLSLAGAIAGLEALFIGIGLILATLMSKTNHLRTIAVCSLTVLALANFTCAASLTVESLFVLRSITGAMSGVIVWVVTSILIRTVSPGRITGFFVATYTGLQGVCVLVLALYLMDVSGWKSCFQLMGAASLLAMFFAFKLPQKVEKLPKVKSKSINFSLPVTYVCLIVFLQLVACMSIWAFLEPLGEWSGASTKTIQIIVSVSLLVQVLGAASGGYLADKVRATLILAIASVFIIVVGVYFLRITPETGRFFFIASLSFSFIWMLILPFHTQLAINTESSGNLALNIPILQISGSVAAPLLGGALALGGDIRNVMQLTLVCGVAALFLTVNLMILRKDNTAIRPS